MRDGAWLIAWGFFQKIFVADNLASLTNMVFDPATHQTGVNVLLGTYAFAFQIYGDFAGYSNIARGLSKLMGIELIENFRFPYFVRSPQSFWRNWHISLSTWLRDYLYIPLGGSRGRKRARRAIFCSRWCSAGSGMGPHGPSSFGALYHGVLLVAYRAAERLKWFNDWITGPAVLARITSWFIMFHLTCYGWLIFRSRSARQLGTLTADLVTGFAPRVDQYRSAAGAAGDVRHTPSPRACLRSGLRQPAHRAPAAARRSILCVRSDVLSHMLFGNFGGGEFIYFQF